MNLLQMTRDWFRRADRLLLWVVVGPTAIALLYFGVIASPVYVSESRYVVRSPEKKSSGGLDAILKATSFTATGDEAFAVKSYILSRDALTAINTDGAYDRAYHRSWFNTVDHFPGIGWDTSFEHLYTYYLHHVAVENESASSINTLTVEAFTPQDAEAINQHLLLLGEKLINRLNARGRADLIQTAQAEVDDAQQKALTAALALSRYRNHEGVLDPEKQAQVQIQLLSKLQDDLIEARNQRDQIRSVAPNTPQLTALDARVNGLTEQIANESGKMVGPQSSLAGTAVSYERLALENQFADRQLASAMTSLEDARSEARQKHVYVERIAEPNCPDKAIEPLRMRGIISTLLVSLLIYGCIKMLLAGMLEHRD